MKHFTKAEAVKILKDDNYRIFYNIIYENYRIKNINSYDDIGYLTCNQIHSLLKNKSIIVDLKMTTQQYMKVIYKIGE